MERGMVCLIVSGLISGGMVQAAWAAEQGGQAAEHQTTPAGVSSTQTTTTPAQSASTTATPSPEVAGSITMLDLNSATPTVRLSGGDGRVWTFALDPKNTSVWKEGRMVKVDELTQGQSVKIRYATMGGKDLAQSIRILSASSPAASAAKPKTPNY